MNDEQAFLDAMQADPGDWQTRLVFADWLEEQGATERAAFLRYQARLLQLDPEHPDYDRFLDRYEEARQDLPSHCLALLDPPVWVLCGETATRPQPSPWHPYYPGVRTRRPPVRQVQRDTRPPFPPRTKVYLAALENFTRQWNRVGWWDEQLEVIGQHRNSRHWIQSVVWAELTTGWRVRLLDQPRPILRLRKARWPGFKLEPESWSPPYGPGDEGTIRSFLEALSP